MTEIIVFARVPLRGCVKRRIAAEAGDDEALRIYTELLEMTAETVQSLTHHVAYAGHCDAIYLQDIFTCAASFFSQTGQTLGERMRNTFIHRFDRGADAVVLIGCDCPTRTAATLLRSVESLEQGHDVVIGPALDGGYHLIGTRRGTDLSFFDLPQWGTSQVYECTRAILGHLSLRVAVSDRLGDIDTMADYRAWRS